MADMDLAPQGGQSLGGVRSTEVGAGHLVAEIQEDFGDAAHADSSDPHEMYFLYFPVHIRSLRSQIEVFARSAHRLRLRKALFHLSLNLNLYFSASHPQSPSPHRAAPGSWLTLPPGESFPATPSAR